MPHLILIAMHGRGRAEVSSYSPPYHWDPQSEGLLDFVTHNVSHNLVFKGQSHPNEELYRGLFWKGVIEAGKREQESGRYDSVHVICSHGIIRSRNRRYVADTVRAYAKQYPGEKVHVIPVGKSLGAFNAMEIVDELTKRKRKNRGLRLLFPYSIMVDPDNFFTPGCSSPKRVVSSEILSMDVLLQKNLRDQYNAPFPGGLFGRLLSRKNRKNPFRDIRHFRFGVDDTFPESESNCQFRGRYINHWTIDEYVMLYGWQGITVQQMLAHFFENGASIPLDGAMEL